MANLLHSSEAIKLAPNSAQIPVLLSKTKQNLFNMREQQESAAAAAAAARGPPPTSTPSALPPAMSQQPVRLRPLPANTFACHHWHWGCWSHTRRKLAN